MTLTHRLAALLTATLILSPLHADAPPDVARWTAEGVSEGKVMSITSAWRTGDAVEYAHAGNIRATGDSPPGLDTQYEIGSITKVFTNLLLAEMVARDLVRYDTTVGELLGDDVAFANDAVADITLARLATHTSGLPRMPGNFIPADPQDPFANYSGVLLEQGIASARAAQPLGEHYAYSNFGLGLLGHLLGQVHGGGYAAALRELVIEPLGLEQTTLKPGTSAAVGSSGGTVVPGWTFDAMAGAGALWGTTTDLLALTDVMLGREASPFRTPIADVLAQTDIEAGAFGVTRVWHTAAAGDATIYWHNGGTGGFRSFVGFRSDDGRAIALLVSGLGDPTGFGLEWLGREAPEQKAGAHDTAIIGTYELRPGFTIRVSDERGRLTAQASGQPELPITRIDDDWYAVDAFDASLHFVREGDAVTAVELAQNGVLQRGERTSDSGEAPEKVEVTLSESELAAFEGAFTMVAAPVTFTIRQRESGLEAQITGQPFYPIFAKGDDVFFYKVVDAELHFERDDDGAVSALTLHQGGIRQRAVRVAE